MTFYKSIFKQFSVYGLLGTLSKAAGLLLLPVYTSYLSPEEYGILELVEVTATIFTMFASAGLGFSVFKFYHRYDDQDEKNRVISSAIVLRLLMHSALAVFGLLFSRTLSSIIFEAPDYSAFLILIFFRIVLEGTIEIGTDYIRVLNRAHLFCFLSLLRLSLSIGLNIFFLAALGMGISGILVSALLSQLLVGIPLLAYLYRRVGIHFDRSKLVPMFKYGLPFVAVLLGQLTLNFADRFFLQRFTTLADVGIYGLGHKFGYLVNFLVLSPFLLMWENKVFEIEKRSDAREIYARVFTYLFLALVCVALALTVFIDQIMILMVDGNYHAAAVVTPLIALAFVFNGLQTFFRLGMLIQGKTSIIGATVVVQSVLSLGMYAVFIRSWGLRGAAWATILSFAGVFVAQYWFSQRLYRIQLELTRVKQIAVSAAIIVLIHSALPDLLLIEAVIVKFHLLALFGVILLTLGFLNEQEKSVLRKTWSSVENKLSPLLASLSRARSRAAPVREGRLPERRIQKATKNVIILTTGGTGSSVLTGLISRAGYWTGNSTFKKREYDTYENRELVDLNSKLLREAGAGDYTTGFVPQLIDRIECLYRQTDIQSYLHFVEKCAAQRPWIWKDPRLWLTIRFWSRFIKMNECRFILLKRDHLQDWIATILRRQILSFSHNRDYSERVNQSIVDFFVAHNVEYLDVCYEDLIVHPAETIARLNEYLGSDLTVHDLEAVYMRNLHKKPRSTWDLMKALLIYTLNYSQRRV